MKRLILLSTLTLLLVILIGATAFATKARIMSLGNTDNYFKDIYHIYANPAYLGLYTNSVYGELGTYYNGMDEYNTPDDQTLGINYKIYKGLSLGLTLNRCVDEWNADVFTQFQYIDEEMYFPEPINGYDLMASYDFEKLHLGVGFYNAGNKATAHEDALEVDVTDDTASYNNYIWKRGSSESWDGEATSGITSLTGGFLFEVDENKWIEGAVTLSFDRAKSNYNEIDTSYNNYTYYFPGRDSNYYDYHSSTKETWEDNYKTKGGNRIELGARAFWEVAENFQIVPLVGFSSESISLDYMLSYDSTYHETEDYSPPYYDTTIYYDTTYSTITSVKTGDYKMSHITIGLGGNLKLDKGMVAGGLNLTRYKTTDETDTTSTYESTSWYMPGFNLGVEYELTKWLTARVGMEKWFGRYESKYESKHDYDQWYPPSHYTGYDRGNGNYKDRFSNDLEDFIGLGVGFKFSKFKVDATFGENTLFEGGYILSGKQNNMFGTLSATFEF